MPKTPENFSIVAAQYTKFGRFEQAVALLTEAVERYPGHFQSLLQLGIAYQMKGDQEKAFDYLGQAEKLDRQRFYTELGSRHVQAGRCESARQSFKEGFPNNTAYVNWEVAQCYLNKGEKSTRAARLRSA